ncbi:MAG TPA: LytR C-terminal domain-containing protein [Gaiellaceae bacterium]|nr:LytR C-terminal domain-containing protein [Gaiellaceae bacterium]
MDHAGQLPLEQRQSPWRLAALAATAVALVELALLLAVAGVRLAPSLHRHASSPAAAAATPPVVTHAATTTAAAATTTPARPRVQPLRPRSRVSVLVLNGNGVTHAAADEASRLVAKGYRGASSADAPSHSYARSLVLFAPGWQREGRRLGHDAGVKVVGPLDGMRPSQLKGSQLVLILGDS